MEMPNMDQIPEEYKDLVTPELLEQAKQCATEEEAIALLQNSGVEIPDEATDWEVLDHDGLEHVIYVLDGTIYHAYA